MNASEAARRAVGMLAEIRTTESGGVRAPQVEAALLITAVMYQTMDWLEAKLQKIWEGMP